VTDKSNGKKNGMTIPYTNGGLEMDEKKMGSTNGHNGNGKGVENMGSETAT